MQTCFQGRFGAETSSDQFGAHIMAHAPARDSGAAVLRLSYVQVSHAGQAFRLGRYPVHAHLNGDMSASYVRGLAIFNSFNRAVNIHGSSNLLVEHVVSNLGRLREDASLHIRGLCLDTYFVAGHRSVSHDLCHVTGFVQHHGRRFLSGGRH